MTSIFVVRHGNTFAAGEPPRRIGCRTDLPLTEEGRAQASALGRWFAEKGIAFSHALYGPLQRTAETARLILASQPTAVPAKAVAMLAEIDHGIDEDKPEPLVQARLGTAALHLWDTEGFTPDGWTVNREDRIAWWRSLYNDPPGEIVLAVTSNGAARFALAALETQARPEGLKLRTGAFGRLEGAGSEAPVRCVEWDVRPSSCNSS